jgi:DNA-binding CsgD family transcriptional regulator
MGMRLQEFVDVGRSANAQEFETNLIAFANRMDFGLISAVFMRGDYDSPDVAVRSVSNTPAAFIALAQSLEQSSGDPVMQRVLRSSMPFTYDQRLYLESGAIDVWETQAPFGYCTGIAVGLHLPHRRHFLIGVDRPRRLPRSETQLTRMLADLQLLAVHAQYAAQVVFGDLLDEPQERPHLTARELECLKWTMDGKSAYVIGKILAISASAVNFHLQNAMRKLNVASKHQAVLRCVGLGML